jgi:hypothetical protein
MQNKKWFHGADKKIDTLDTKGSAMNLWGSKGAYLSDSYDAAQEFGSVVSTYLLNTDKILNTDNEIEDYGIINRAVKHAKIPFMVVANAEIETYGDLIAIMGEYTGGDRKEAVEFLQYELGIDALYTPSVGGQKDGRSFSEGNVLIILTNDAVKPQHQPAVNYDNVQPTVVNTSLANNPDNEIMDRPKRR